MAGGRVVKRLFAWMIGLPVGLLAILLSVANRNPVVFSLDPLSPDDPAVAFEVPLYVLLFAAGFVGLVIGWLVGWGGQAELRRELKARRREMRSGATAPQSGRPLLSGS